MRRMLVLLILAFLLSMRPAQAIPARLAYRPIDYGIPAVDLRGTCWDSKDLAEDRHICFVADGTLRYGPAHQSNGWWRMEGDHCLYFEINDGYRKFRGAMIENRIHGDSWNITGVHWSTTLYREDPFPP